MDYPDLEAELASHYVDPITGLTDLSSAVQENLLRIEIFYDRISQAEVTESPAVTDFAFISDVGTFDLNPKPKRDPKHE